MLRRRLAAAALAVLTAALLVVPGVADGHGRAEADR
jgi:hypothetical protein